MVELAAAAVVWGGVLWYLAAAPRERAQMTWLLLVAVVATGPFLAVIFPSLR